MAAIVGAALAIAAIGAIIGLLASGRNILAFAAHFNLSPEMSAETLGQARKIASDHGIGLLITYFQGAARMAAAEREEVTWDHFQRTIDALEG